MLRLWQLLVSLYLPLCATAGVTGITPPGVVDFTRQHFHYDKAVLAAPAGFIPTPQLVTPVFNLPPAALFAAISAFIAAHPRTYPLDVEQAQLQAAWVIRTGGSNFPDMVEIAVLPEAGGKSGLILSSHAIYGWYDLGVNHRRATAWLHDFQQKVAE